MTERIRFRDNPDYQPPALPPYTEGPCPFCGGQQVRASGISGGGIGHDVRCISFEYTYCGKCQKQTSRTQTETKNPPSA